MAVLMFRNIHIGYQYIESFGDENLLTPNESFQHPFMELNNLVGVPYVNLMSLRIIL